ARKRLRMCGNGESFRRTRYRGLEWATQFYYVARPPDISNTAPVLNEHSFDASQATSEAISCTGAVQPIGTSFRMDFTTSGVNFRSCSVSTTVGVTQLTKTPPVASSLPSDLVRPITPALAAERAHMFGTPSLPATAATFTIRPLPRASMCGMTALQQLNVP